MGIVAVQFVLWTRIISSRLVPATLTQIVRKSSWKWCWARPKNVEEKNWIVLWFQFIIILLFRLAAPLSLPLPFPCLNVSNRLFYLPKILVQMVSSRLRAVSYRIIVVVCNHPGWYKNETDFKRKGGLQALKVSSHDDSLVLVTLGRGITKSHFLSSIISIKPSRIVLA